MNSKNSLNFEIEETLHVAITIACQTPSTSWDLGFCGDLNSNLMTILTSVSDHGMIIKKCHFKFDHHK